MTLVRDYSVTEGRYVVLEFDDQCNCVGLRPDVNWDDPRVVDSWDFTGMRPPAGWNGGVDWKDPLNDTLR